MARARGRSFATSLVGWVVVALLVYLAIGFLIGTILWILRLVAVLVVIGALLALYLKLRNDE